MSDCLTMLARGLAICLAGVLCAVSSAAWGGPLQYRGGIVLSHFTIYPLYYGDWTNSVHSPDDIHAYLQSLADYMSGAGAPSGQQAVTRQYGALHVKLGPKAFSPEISPDPYHNLQTIIQTNQAFGRLPVFAGEVLILVIPGPDYNLCGGFHASESVAAFYAIAPIVTKSACGVDYTYDLISHEVFEAAGNPANGGKADAWNELSDGCTTNMPVTTKSAAGVHDNTQDGACSMTGYSPIVSKADDAYAYFLANKPTTASYNADTTFQYNSTGAANTITRLSTGKYQVYLPSLALSASNGAMHVTAFGTDPTYCNVQALTFLVPGVGAIVNCFGSGGMPADTSFTASFATTKRDSDLSFVYADNPTAPSYTPQLGRQFNPFFPTAKQTVVRASTGNYTVTIPGIVQFSAKDPQGGGIPMVTSYSVGHDTCKVAKWTPGATDVTVQVLCFSPNGAPADAPFTMSFRRKTDLMGRFAHDHAYAWAHGSSATLVSANQYDTQFGNLSMTRTSAGQYIVTVPNQNNVGGNVQVTGVGTGPERCKVGKWYATGSDQAIHIGCFNASGAAADSDFIFSYIGGDWPFIPPVCINCPPKP